MSKLAKKRLSGPGTDLNVPVDGTAGTPSGKKKAGKKAGNKKGTRRRARVVKSNHTESSLPKILIPSQDQ